MKSEPDACGEVPWQQWPNVAPLLFQPEAEARRDLQIDGLIPAERLDRSVDRARTRQDRGGEDERSLAPSAGNSDTTDATGDIANLQLSPGDCDHDGFNDCTTSIRVFRN